MQVENGMPADLLTVARWRKSSASNPSGTALVCHRTELAGFLLGVKNGEFDTLI